MTTNTLEASVIFRFFLALKDQGTEVLYPQSSRPVLYLKCWGSDYPYLQGVEQPKRWLPVVGPSARGT